MSDFTYEEKVTGTPLEKYEWDNVWWESTEKTDTPRALYIGDSISCGTRRIATDKADCKMLFDGFGTSKAIDNPYFIPTLHTFALQEGHREVIFFNNGLHGWHLSVDEYAEHYEKTVRFLLEEYKGTPLVLVMTTFVINEERNARVIERNKKVSMIAEKYGLDVVDLYSVSQDVSEHIKPDGVHFTADGYGAFAEALLKCAKKYCGID